MPTIVPIHGTFAAGPEEGDQWWQRGSPFERHFRECIEANEGDLSFQPLHWNGKNSEDSRRKAAANLLKQCEALENRGEKYVLIGHSHGGSIISNALLLASKAKLPLPNLMQAITVGTPFIHLAKRSALLNIFVPVLLIVVFLAALGAVVSSATTSGGFLNRQLAALDPAFNHERSSQCALGDSPAPPSARLAIDGRKPFPETHGLVPLTRSDLFSLPSAFEIIENTYKGIVGFAVLFIIKLFLDERAKADSAISRTNIHRARNQYASRWLGIAHAHDEAIGGLSRAITLGQDLLMPKINIQIWAIFTLLQAALFIVFFLFWVVLFSAAKQIQPFSPNILSNVLRAITESPGPKIGLAVAIVFAGCLTVVCISKRLSEASVGALLSEFSQRLFLRLDFPGQSATKISDRPMWSEQPPVGLPVGLAEQLTVFDESQSLAFVETLRRELYSALESKNAEALPNFSELMAAFELTHTAYFNSPLFRKLIFAALIEQPALRATSVFSTDPDFGWLREWLRKYRTQASKDASVSASAM
ncbi:MAG: hypothetical protein FJX48_04750 [Alphaproteobacteria bacterium]|nr:hypothetical protein [Alphaproteobacteria bacterium]